MSDAISNERLKWELEQLKERFEELSPRHWVKEELRNEIGPIKESIGKLTNAMEEMGREIKSAHKTQNELMQERGQREKAEYEFRIQQQKEKHEAELKLIESSLEEAKNNTAFNKLTKQIYPIMLVAASAAVIFNQIIVPILKNLPK